MLQGESHTIDLLSIQIVKYQSRIAYCLTAKYFSCIEINQALSWMTTVSGVPSLSPVQIFPCLIEHMSKRREGWTSNFLRGELLPLQWWLKAKHFLLIAFLYSKNPVLVTTPPSHPTPILPISTRSKFKWWSHKSSLYCYIKLL